MTLPHDLSAWLEHIEHAHPVKIDLGLARTAQCAQRLDLLKPAPIVITVTGTNGKGSTVKLLESFYRAMNYQVGAYSSPHLLRYNERIRINTLEVSDNDICRAFTAVENIRDEITLSYFEYSTLAALWLFKEAKCDVVILEVGLGGRLDATNVVDADVAVVTSIDLDHTAILGPDREAIAREKSGIFRKNQQVVCGEPEIPNSLYECAEKLNVSLYAVNQQFFYKEFQHAWQLQIDDFIYAELPKPKLLLQNCATAITVLHLLRERLPITHRVICEVLSTVALNGRLQCIPGDVELLLDVSHNPHGARALSRWLDEHPIRGKNFALFSMLRDKDIAETVSIVAPHIAHWFVAPLDVDRAASIDMLQQAVSLYPHTTFASITDAYRVAKSLAKKGDRIVIFGSFYCVADAISVCL